MSCYLWRGNPISTPGQNFSPSFSQLLYLKSLRQEFPSHGLSLKNEEKKERLPLSPFSPFKVLEAFIAPGGAVWGEIQIDEVSQNDGAGRKRERDVFKLQHRGGIAELASGLTFPRSFTLGTVLRVA